MKTRSTIALTDGRTDQYTVPYVKEDTQNSENDSNIALSSWRSNLPLREPALPCESELCSSDDELRQARGPLPLLHRDLPVRRVPVRGREQVSAFLPEVATSCCYGYPQNMVRVPSRPTAGAKTRWGTLHVRLGYPKTRCEYLWKRCVESQKKSLPWPFYLFGWIFAVFPIYFNYTDGFGFPALCVEGTHSMPVAYSQRGSPSVFGVLAACFGGSRCVFLGYLQQSSGLSLQGETH